MSVGLVIFEITHPSSGFEVSYPLSFSSVLHEISFVFLPIISLHSDESLIRLILLICLSDYARVTIVLNSSAMELSPFKLSFVSDPLLIPIQFSVSLHLPFYPVSYIQLPIVVLVEAFALSIRLLVRWRALPNQNLSLTDIATVFVLIIMSLLSHNTSFITVTISILSISRSGQLIFIVKLSSPSDLRIYQASQIICVLSFLFISDWSQIRGQAMRYNLNWLGCFIQQLQLNLLVMISCIRQLIEQVSKSQSILRPLLDKFFNQIYQFLWVNLLTISQQLINFSSINITGRVVIDLIQM